MPTKDPRVDKYIAKSADFARPILNHLRQLVHTGCPQVEEAMKWSFPFFLYKGMLCNMAAFKEHCSFGFWKGELILGRSQKAQGEGDGMGHFGRITSLADLPKDEVILGYLKKAVELNDAGIKKETAPKTKAKKELVIPDYLTAALKKDKKAAATFAEFSYSHRKEYVEWLTEAKREETRQQRLATTIEWLAEGKSRNWKYANC